MVIRKNDQFEFKLSFTTKSTIDRARWYVPSVKFLLQADASDENMILPDDAELMSVRSSELELSLSVLTYYKQNAGANVDDGNIK